jgi:S1-C subfamily serine protease
MAEPQVKKEKIGVQLQTLKPEMASALGLAPDARGAVVTDVEANSVAAKAGLQPEDLIVEVDRKQVGGAEEAATALHASGKATHLLKVLRAGTFLFVTVGAQ